jgi:hypothetical protein
MGLPTPTFSHGGWETKSKPKNKMNFDEKTVMEALTKNNDE